MHLKIRKLDPLLCNFEMPLHAVYYPLGFPLEVATNSQEILAAAEESWGHFRKTFPGPTLQLRIGVVEGGSLDCPPEPVCREQRNLLVHVADAGNFAVTDLQQGFSFAWLTQAAVQHRPYLRWNFVEAMSWDLLEALCITPVHAACVKVGDRGILLCGDDGAGKSTLAYACARYGWTYISDDSCCLVRGRNDRMVVGNPYQIRFRESAIGILPELRQHRRTPHNGEMAIEVVTASLPDIKTAVQCSIDYVIFLNRGALSAPQLVPFPQERALQWLDQIICWGMEPTRDAHKVALRNLLSAEILELRYSDLLSAVELLETRLHTCRGAQQEAVASDEGTHA